MNKPILKMVVKRVEKAMAYNEQGTVYKLVRFITRYKDVNRQVKDKWVNLLIAEEKQEIY